VLSQSFAFIDHPIVNRVKAGLRLPSVLDYVGFRPVLTADYDLRSSFPARVLDRLLYLYPSRERCTDGVCRRLLLLYGEVIRHDQLDQATHDRMYEMFDRANLTTFKHLAKMIARGHIVDQFGKNTYLTRAKGLQVNIPITLLQGTANGLFRPSGARKTHEWLIAHGGFGSTAANREKFRLLPIDGFGHLDNFIGKHASTAVFPELVRALRSM
jgi:cholesterol oxidase